MFAWLSDGGIGIVGDVEEDSVRYPIVGKTT